MSSYVARKMLSTKAEGVFAPLLETEVDSSDEESSDDDSDASSRSTIPKRTPMQQLKWRAVVGGLLGGAGVSVAAIVFSPGIFTIIMGGLCIANVPYSIAKERKIGTLPSLRALNSRLKEDADHLEEEVDGLGEEIDELQPEAHRAAVLEEQLRSISDAQEVNVDTLVDLVKENERILSQMRDNLRQRVVQDIISIVIKSDIDDLETIDSKEAKTLALRIRISLQEYGVAFDNEKFVEVIGRGTTVPAVIALVTKLLPMEQSGTKEDYSESDEDSDIGEDGIYDMFHMVDDPNTASDGSTVSGEEGISLVACDRRKMTQKRRSMRRKETLACNREVQRQLRDRLSDSDSDS